MVFPQSRNWRHYDRTGAQPHLVDRDRGGRPALDLAPGRQASAALTVVFNGGLIVWGADEIVRWVNPWRRCLGAAVVLYEVTTAFGESDRGRSARGGGGGKDVGQVSEKAACGNSERDAGDLGSILRWNRDRRASFVLQSCPWDGG